MSWKQLGTRRTRRTRRAQRRPRDVPRRDGARPSPTSRLRRPSRSSRSSASVTCRRGPTAGRPRRSTRYQTALQRALEVSGEAWVSVTTLRDRTYPAGRRRELPSSRRGRHRRDGRRPAPALRRRPRRPRPRLTRRRTAGRSRRRTDGCVPQPGGLQERRGHRPQLPPLPCVDGLPAVAEGSSAPGFHLADHQGVAAREDEIELARRWHRQLRATSR